MIKKCKEFYSLHTSLVWLLMVLLLLAGIFLFARDNTREDIIVDSFSSNDVIGRPLEIHGEAKSDWFVNGAFPITVVDSRGIELGKVDAVALKDWRNTDSLVPFQAVFSYIPSNTQRGHVVLHKLNEKGDIIDVYKVAISFGSKKVLLFYPNEPEACGAEPFEGVVRYVSKETKIRDAIELLIAGEIREDEKEKGFYSYFPNSEFALMDVNQEGETVTLKFTPARAFTTGSPCYVQSLRTSIEQTTKQFYGVREVKFVPENLFEI